MPAIVLQPPETVAGSGEGLMFETKLHCTGCPRTQTFTVPSLSMVRQQIAAAGWKVDPLHGLAECPACWMAYERSVIAAAKGNW